MDPAGPDPKRELVLRVFPELRSGGDRDLERYFELRRSGRLGEALSLYNGPLRARYPDDQARILLLRLYREGDPRWQGLQARLLEGLGERLAGRVRGNADALVEPLSAASLRSAYGALGAVEGLLRRLGAAGSPDGALELLERQLGFARVLGYRVRELERARDLLAEYIALGAAEAPDEQDFVARSRALEERRRRASPRSGGTGAAPEERIDFIARSEALEERRREAERSRARFFDLSRLSFSAAEASRILLEREPERHEDLVLAYCAKYWKASLEPGFERLVFLYSHKHGTRHHELYRAVRIGRLRKRSDDEILSALSSILSRRYSYSVTGDLYMQEAWRRIKAGLEAQALPEEPRRTGPRPAGSAARPPARPKRSPAEAGEPTRLAAGPAASPLPPEERRGFEPETRSGGLPAFAARPPEFALRRLAALPPKEGPTRPAGTPAPRPAAPPAEPAALRRAALPSSAPPQARSRLGAPQPAEPRLRSRAPSREQAPVELRAAPSAKAERGADAGTRAAASRPPRSEAGLRPRKAGAPRGARLLAPQAAAPEPIPAIRPRGGSISDRIRRLSGRNYDVYKAIFLEKLRESIRRGLLAARTRKAGLFDTSANEAEDIVYGFMAAHYEDPFMDWEGSGERILVEELGYALPSLDPLIEACYRRLS